MRVHWIFLQWKSGWYRGIFVPAWFNSHAGAFYRINGEFKLGFTSLCKLRKYYEVKFDERQIQQIREKALAEIDKADGLEN